MIEAGAIGNPPHIDAAISLHVGNFLGTGEIGVKDGPFTGSSDEVYITVKGDSCHASAPHEGVDPVHIAAMITTSIQGWLTRFVDPVEPTVFTVGKIEGGTRYNIISDTAQMDCTLRTLNEKIRDQIRDNLPKFCDGIARAHGGSAEVRIVKGYAVGVNAKELNDHFRKIHSQYFGSDKVIEQDNPVLGAEDFYEFSLKGKIPVAMFWMSTTNEEKGFTASNHASTFDIDEEVLYMGVTTLAGSAMAYLNS
jgi:amidohydrolase